MLLKNYYLFLSPRNKAQELDLTVPNINSVNTHFVPVAYTHPQLPHISYHKAHVQVPSQACVAQLLLLASLDQKGHLNSSKV